MADMKRAASLAALYLPINTQPHIAKFYGITTYAASPVAVGEDGVSLKEALCFLHAKGDTLDMGAILAIAEQVFYLIFVISGPLETGLATTFVRIYLIRLFRVGLCLTHIHIL